LRESGLKLLCWFLFSKQVEDCVPGNSLLVWCRGNVIGELAENSPVPIRLLAAANLCAALGSGKLLSDIMSFAADGDEQRLSAFLVGTIIGLSILVAVPARLKSALRVWLSLGAAGCSALLLGIFVSFQQGGRLEGISKHCFFVLLCMRFGFWFVPRVLRSNLAAGYHQKISYVEMAYYGGVCAGLIMWGQFGLKGGVLSALALDIILQICAAALDGLSLRSAAPAAPGAALATALPARKSDWVLFGSLTAILASSTVGTQIVIFLLSHSFEDRHSEFLADVTIATFYAGAAAAAILCAYWKPSLAIQGRVGTTWERTMSICFSGSSWERSVSFASTAITGSVMVLVTLVVGFANHQSAATVLPLVVISTVLYEIMFLVMLDRLGEERDRSGRPWLVSTAFGLVGSVAAASYIGIHHVWGVLSIRPLEGTVVLTLAVTLFTVLVPLRGRVVASARTQEEAG
jgi:hypothetical protein